MFILIWTSDLKVLTLLLKPSFQRKYVLGSSLISFGEWIKSITSQIQQKKKKVTGSCPWPKRL